MTNEDTWIDRPELPGDFWVLSGGFRSNMDIHVLFSENAFTAPERPSKGSLASGCGGAIIAGLHHQTGALRYVLIGQAHALHDRPEMRDHLL